MSGSKGWPIDHSGLNLWLASFLPVQRIYYGLPPAGLGRGVSNECYTIVGAV